MLWPLPRQSINVGQTKFSQRPAESNSRVMTVTAAVAPGLGYIVSVFFQSHSHTVALVESVDRGCLVVQA
eukprot:SAG31_NODE_211_length_20274_cov_40.333482_18_plen_70_part_00